MKYLILATVAIFVLAGCESKPHYRIDGYKTYDYTEKNNCVFFIPAANGCGTTKGSEMKMCGEYQVSAHNGALLKREVTEFEY